MLLEIVRCFDDTLHNDLSISEAVAAIQTLLEVIKRSNGEFILFRHSTHVKFFIFQFIFIIHKFIFYKKNISKCFGLVFVASCAE